MSTAFPYIPQNELAGTEEGSVDFPYGANVEIISPAEGLRRRIYNELEGTSVASFALEQSWVRVGVLLSEFKAKEYWRQYEQYTTFDDFISELKTRFKRGRTALYSYLGVADLLLPAVSSAKLEEMGIAKALELKRALKKLDGKPLPQDLIDKALEKDKTTKELRGDIGKALNLEPDEKGTWMDMDGFFTTREERAEFKEAWLITEALLGLKKDIPDHIRRKEIILTWMREWLGTHAAEFYGDKGVKTCKASFINNAIAADRYVP